MKHLRNIFVSSIIVGLVVAWLALYVTIERQKRFEAFAAAHIQLLMEELSATNINASSLEKQIEDLQEQIQKFKEETASQPFRQRRCGKNKEEDEK